MELQSAGVLRVEDGNHGEYRPRRDEFVEAGTAFVRAADIRDGIVDFEGADKINEVALARIRKGIGQPGDLLLTHKGTVGRVARVPADAPPYVCSPQTTFWRVLEPRALNPDYLYAFLRSPSFTRQLRQRQHETDMAPYVSLTAQRQLDVLVPPISQQRAIGRVTRAIDDKIDSNRRLTALLEKTVTTMFRARFVDFVGQSGFVETELGRVPRGWTVAPIGDVVNVVGGGTPSTKESRYWDGGSHCWATPKDLAGARSSVLLDTSRHITDEGVERISSGLLPERTVLLSSRAPVGYTAISMVGIAVNQGFIAIPPSDSVPSEYVLLWLRENMDRIKAHAGGTTFAEISKRAFRPLLMLVAPASALAEFERATRPMFDLIAGQEREIHALSRTRDSLLPKLVSGEIRVPDTSDPTEAMDALAEEAPA